MANGNAHTHALEITTYGSKGNRFIIKYGDQTKRVNGNFPGWKKRLERKVKAIVVEHDKGSMKYAAKEAKVQSFNSVAGQIVDKSNALYLTNTSTYRYRPEPIQGLWASDPDFTQKRLLVEAYDMHNEWMSRNYAKNDRMNRDAEARGQKVLS